MRLVNRLIAVVCWSIALILAVIVLIGIVAPLSSQLSQYLGEATGSEGNLTRTPGVLFLLKTVLLALLSYELIQLGLTFWIDQYEGKSVLRAAGAKLFRNRD